MRPAPIPVPILTTNMRNYLILRDKVWAFRPDPEVQQALAESRVLDLWEPTLAAGETLADLRSATYDLDGLAKRGMHFERLDQLALEYLYGVR